MRTPGNISQCSMKKKEETKRSLKSEFKNVLFVRIHTISIYRSMFFFFGSFIRLFKIMENVK